MARLRVFAAAREVVGASVVDLDGDTVSAVLDAAVTRFGEPFAVVLADSRVWLNGDECAPDASVSSGDEIAVLPPVSGGA